MCLIKTHKIPRSCIFPKTVYKIVIKDFNEEFITPFRGYPIKIGETYTGKFNNNKRTLFNTINESEVEDGFIHSFKSLITAEAEATGWKTPLNIVKCKIPSFTFYYEGRFDEIASRKLKYIKIIS